jgi:hypothetical protein
VTVRANMFSTAICQVSEYVLPTAHRADVNLGSFLGTADFFQKCGAAVFSEISGGKHLLEAEDGRHLLNPADGYPVFIFDLSRIFIARLCDKPLTDTFHGSHRRTERLAVFWSMMDRSDHRQRTAPFLAKSGVSIESTGDVRTKTRIPRPWH